MASSQERNYMTPIILKPTSKYDIVRCEKCEGQGSYYPEVRVDVDVFRKSRERESCETCNGEGSYAVAVSCFITVEVRMILAGKERFLNKDYPHIEDAKGLLAEYLEAGVESIGRDFDTHFKIGGPNDDNQGEK